MRLHLHRRRSAVERLPWAKSKGTCLFAGSAVNASPANKARTTHHVIPPRNLLFASGEIKASPQITPAPPTLSFRPKLAKRAQWRACP